MQHTSTFFGVRLLLLLLFALTSLLAQAQAPTWQTAVTSIKPDDNTRSKAFSVATDAQGNVYLAGSFDHTIHLGSLVLTSRGFSDVFVAKWSPATGSFVWAQQAGGATEDEAVAIAVQGTSVYVAGNFQSATAYFGPTVLMNALPDNFGSDVFVAKLTDEGTTGHFNWAKSAGGTGSDVATSLAVRGTSVYVAGSFSSTDAGFGTTILGAVGVLDGFVAQLTDLGSAANFAWAQQVSGTGFEGVNALAVQDSHVYVAGYFTSATAHLGSLRLANAGNGSNDVFVAKLIDPTIVTRTAGAAGNPDFVWAQRAGGASSDFVYGLAVQGPSVYIAGSFIGATTTFGNITLPNASTTGTSDVFVAKLTDELTAANFMWAQRAGGVGNDGARDVAIQGAGVYVAGDFDSPTASFGSTTLSNTDPSYGSYRNLFVAKLHDGVSAGTFTWAQQAGTSAGDDRVQKMALHGPTVYVTGYFSGLTACFGNLTLVGRPFAPAAYLASLSDDGVLTASQPDQAPEIELYPNPAHTLTTVRVPKTLSSRNAGQVQVLNALGQVVRTARLSPALGEAVLDVTVMSPGVYLLQIPTATGRASRRLVVE
ncbi:T9SS type A sorting domain-containing protein [Hymenobacter cavernae]|uniref:Secretion system C-terminal sorting domain-containing protein n=1 Tax=Hymenobacter cavernae TaxID=2044852 RepID=A0ABQ1UIK5_9BACT|nr:T9SS type A sorting domain-containing protein [Hymenobacter cavernae]GGF18929.1 hypothetical protein GCM10011383_33040 [Hymenobacter cavernae]